MARRHQSHVSSRHQDIGDKINWDLMSRFDRQRRNVQMLAALGFTKHSFSLEGAAELQHLDTSTAQEPPDLGPVPTSSIGVEGYVQATARESLQRMMQLKDKNLRTTITGR